MTTTVCHPAHAKGRRCFLWHSHDRVRRPSQRWSPQVIAPSGCIDHGTALFVRSRLRPQLRSCFHTLPLVISVTLQRGQRIDEIGELGDHEACVMHQVHSSHPLAIGGRAHQVRHSAKAGERGIAHMACGAENVRKIVVIFRQDLNQHIVDAVSGRGAGLIIVITKVAHTPLPDGAGTVAPGDDGAKEERSDHRRRREGQHRRRVRRDGKRSRSANRRSMQGDIAGVLDERECTRHPTREVTDGAWLVYRVLDRPALLLPRAARH
ncbi:hypothetical protein [Tahibacter amnicola]|uniref:Uncharacterized protein n=1 Tax=Tahibacter amnicola TaxID=2976241 RepID=A0ABY6BHP8_9GAMM|nr:hypothetical protein [Tahibacter amnicola]UXI69302.1 hypothetical protein N4264_06545 [Tahibacter amnicola]